MAGVFLLVAIFYLNIQSQVENVFVFLIEEYQAREKLRSGMRPVNLKMKTPYVLNRLTDPDG